jgi:hypothetical protein
MVSTRTSPSANSLNIFHLFLAYQPHSTEVDAQLLGDGSAGAVIGSLRDVVKEASGFGYCEMRDHGTLWA